jgi:outer membrane autotransporter protein
LIKNQTSKYLKKCLGKALLAGTILATSICCGTTDAQTRQTFREIKNSDGNIIFRLDLYGEGQTYDDSFNPKSISVRDFTNGEIDALTRALQYWVDVLYPTGNIVTPAIMRIGVDPDNRYNAYSVAINATSGLPRVYEIIHNNTDPGTRASNVTSDEVSGYHGLMAFNNFTDGWGIALHTQLDEGPNSMEPIMIHEMGHTLGITNYVAAFSSKLTGGAGSQSFTGTEATKIFGDDWLDKSPVNIPMAHGSDQEYSHFGFQNGLMTHQHFRNYSAFMEVELAALIDVGYDIDLRNFFGRSIYTDNNSNVVNNNGYFARSGNAYVTGTANTASHGLGLHIYGSNNNVTQNADLLSVGTAGGGIRVDGFNNTVRINDNVKVYANGERGTGLLVAFGTNHKIIHQGDLRATGKDGIAARFDFGTVYSTDHVLPDAVEAHSYDGAEGVLNLYAEFDNGILLNPNESWVAIDDALVDSFDVSGSITGNKAAIYIADNAHVKQINFMKGAIIDGNIRSDYTDGGRITTLTFGKQANVNGEAQSNGDNTNFTINIASNIGGAGKFDLETWGGETTLSAATLTFNEGTIGSDSSNIKSKLNLPGTVQFQTLNLGSATNTSSELDGNSTGLVFVNGSNVQNFITVSELALLQVQNDLSNETTGKLIDNTEYYVGGKLSNAGIIDGSTLIHVEGGDIDNSGSIQNVTKLKAANTNLNNAATGELINNATIEVSANFNNAGYINTTNGQVTVGDKFNNNAGLVSGNGNITTTNGFINNGFILPGNSIGTLTIAGPFVNNAAGTFGIELDPSHYPSKPFAGLHNDLVKINAGTATINGGTVLVASQSNDKTKTAAPARYVGNTHYTFLDTETAGNLSVNNALTTQDPADILLFDFVADHDTKSYWLDVQREYYYGQFGDTRNQVALGNYIDQIGLDPNPLGDFFDVLVSLDKLNAGIAHRTGISRAAKFSLDQMSGSVYATIANAGIQNTTIVNNTLADVLRRNAFNSQADCNPCDEVDDSCDPCDPCASCDQYESCDSCDPRKSSRWNTWGLGFGTGGRTQFDGNAYGYNQSFAGTIIGIDRLYKRNLRVGAFASYGEGRVSSGLLDRSKSNEFLAGLYLRKGMNVGYFMANAGLGNNRYDTQRTISFVNRKTKNEHDAIVGTVYLERGLEIKRHRSVLQPFFGLQYVGSQQDGFTEQGAGSLNLTAASTDGHSLRSLLGSRFSTNARKFNKGKLSYYGNAIWMHEFLRSYTNFSAEFSNPAFANFSSTGKFTVRGNDSKRDWAIIGAGVNYEKNRVRLFAGYDAYANGQQVLHTGNAGFVYGW